MTAVIVFDVNETLLDTRALDPWFARVFGTASMRERWFRQFEVLWLVTVATGRHAEFTVLAEAALQMCAAQHAIDLSVKDRGDLPERLKALPPHPDARAALKRLKDAGCRLGALSNGALKATRAQLKFAELGEFFERVLSADEVASYKPAPQPYRLAEERFAVEPAAMRLVSAHAWDVAGAHACGWKTAFIARPGKVPNPAGAAPGMQATDLDELAQAILAVGT
jgi:2-haloacid dehalogenase